SGTVHLHQVSIRRARNSRLIGPGGDGEVRGGGRAGDEDAAIQTQRDGVRGGGAGAAEVAGEDVGAGRVVLGDDGRRAGVADGGCVARAIDGDGVEAGAADGGGPVDGRIDDEVLGRIVV